MKKRFFLPVLLAALCACNAAVPTPTPTPAPAATPTVEAQPADALTLQAEEVQAVRWASREDIYRLQAEGRFCPNPKGMIDLLFDLNEEGLAR